MPFQSGLRTSVQGIIPKVKRSQGVLTKLSNFPPVPSVRIFQTAFLQTFSWSSFREKLVKLFQILIANCFRTRKQHSINNYSAISIKIVIQWRHCDVNRQDVGIYYQSILQGKNLEGSAFACGSGLLWHGTRTAIRTEPLAFNEAKQNTCRSEFSAMSTTSRLLLSTLFKNGSKRTAIVHLFPSHSFALHIFSANCMFQVFHVYHIP